MRYFILAVRDNKHDGFMQPLITQNVRQAARQFTDLQNDPESQIGKHPKEFDLHSLGYIDTDAEPMLVNERSVVVKGDQFGIFEEHDRKESSK